MSLSIDSLFDQSLLLDMIAGKYVRLQNHSVLSLSILNYTEKAQYEGVWNEVTRQCRGLIYNPVTREVKARPFQKFLIWQDQKHKPELGWNAKGSPRFFDKMDGSLGILYQSHDGLAIATRGSFVSDQALHATKILREHYPHFCPSISLTYLFEIVYPDNRIVVDYEGIDDIFLLDVIETTTGKSVKGCHGWSGHVVGEYFFDSVEAAAEAKQTNKEGYVIYWPETDFRVKIKHEEYVRLHRLITGINARRIWEILSAGESVEELLVHVPEEFEEWVLKTSWELKESFVSLQRSVYEAWHKAAEDSTHHVDFLTNERKAFALTIAKHPYSAAMFLLYDDRSIYEWTWKQIKPEFERPYKNMSEDVA